MNKKNTVQQDVASAIQLLVEIGSRVIRGGLAAHAYAYSATGSMLSPTQPVPHLVIVTTDIRVVANVINAMGIAIDDEPLARFFLTPPTGSGLTIESATVEHKYLGRIMITSDMDCKPANAAGPVLSITTIGVYVLPAHYHC